MAAVAAIACTSAFAGGPLYIFDAATKTPYAWPAGNTPFYTDLGTLGQLSNAEANAMVAFSVGQWNAIPTCTFNGVMAGGFDSIGLPDIDGVNILEVFGVFNGGGVDVVYDTDGAITTLIFGNPFGVLGVTLIDYVDQDSPEIQETTVILNGLFVPEPPTPPAEAAAMFAGISTHEFGHAINLAHSQTNGSMIYFYEFWLGPSGCPVPYDGYPSADDVETMYPITSIPYTGIPEGTVDILDDMAAASDIYPAPGWPAAYPAISGTVYVPRRANSPQRTQVIGANVVARNQANPWRDAISAISGDHTQGALGQDGTYAFHGLTPGASYVLYDDTLLVGAYATTPPSVLPGPEEYWNSLESGDGVTDDRCASTPIAASTGSPTIADLTFNKVLGAPEFIPINLIDSTITELSGDGQVAAGVWGDGVIRWTPAGGPETIGGDWRSPQVGLSRDGKTITASVVDAYGVQTAGIWQAKTGWASLGVLPGGAPCDNGLSSGWGVSDHKTVAGMSNLGCENYTATQWTSNGGVTNLGFLGDPGTFGSSRANRISADGSTVVGLDQDPGGFWRGAQWRDGQESLFHQPPVLCCDFDPVFCTVDTVGSATAVNPNGSVIVGEYFASQEVFVDPDTGEEFHSCRNGSWRWTPDEDVIDLGEFIPDYTPLAQDVSDDGSVIVGVALPFDFFLPRRAILWTALTGYIDFQEFLAVQGTIAPEWSLLLAGTIAGNAQSVAGFGASPYGGAGFVVQMPKIVICHAPPGTPSDKKTTNVSFPDSLAHHIAHGDTIGLCGNGQ